MKFTDLWTGVRDSLFFNRSASIPPVEVAPTWYLAWGVIDSACEGIAWRDNQIAIALPPTQHSVQSPLALSLTLQFVVVGDVWLSNREELLRRLGVEPKASLSNCQVVAQLWERWGVETLELLEGMYGLAVWDRERQILWLGRDRVGARTLYYTTEGATRWIAPQLRTLAPYRSQDLDLVALRDYLCCAFVPGGQTLWQQVREVRPGTSLRLPEESTQIYWQVKEQITVDQPIEWHGERLRSLLEQVVKEYLPPGKPVGVFLSGGLDSSCITALAANHDSVHTYSIHFGADYPNELEHSSLVAEHCQTQHHILEITPAQMWEQLPETIAYLDDPIGDPLTVPNLLLGRLARNSVRVVLNDEGGDPCFGGPKNQPMLINNLYGSVANQPDPLTAYLNSFQKCALDLPQLLKPEIWAVVKTKPSVFAADLNADATYLNRLMTLNIKFKGADQILTKVNNLTQAAGIEGRSPFFDQRVVASRFANSTRVQAFRGAGESSPETSGF